MPDDFEQFRQRVFQDMALQDKLRSVSDHAAFVALVAQLGHERGFEFAPDEVRAAMQASRRAWLERWIA